MDTSALAPRPRVLHSTTHRVPTTLGTAFITVTADEVGAPFEAFVDVGKAGTDTFAVAEAVGRLVSLILRMPSSLTRQERVKEIVRQLTRVGGALRPIHAPPDAVAIALAEQIQLDMDVPKDVLATETKRRSGRPQVAKRPPASRPSRGAYPLPALTETPATRPESIKFLQLKKTDPGQGANQVTKLRPELKQAAQALGDALKNTPVLRAYDEAAAKLGADR